MIGVYAKDFLFDLWLTTWIEFLKVAWNKYMIVVKYDLYFMEVRCVYVQSGCVRVYAKASKVLVLMNSWAKLPKSVVRHSHHLNNK